MHEVLRQRLARQIEALPEEKIYQVLDYIEFLNSKYARGVQGASGLQRFGERLQDKLRGQGVGLSAIRGTLDAVSTADRMVSGLTEAGRTLLKEVEAGFTPPEPRPSGSRPVASLPPSPRDEPPVSTDEPRERI